MLIGMNQHDNKNFKNTLQKLYPHYSDNELEELDRTIYRHVALLVRMTERLTSTKNSKMDTDH